MKRRSILLTFLCMVLMVPASFCSVQDSVGATRINNVLHIQYLVEPGETIYGISTKYHVSISDLLEINPELENGLKVGQVINIPYDKEAVEREKLRRTAGVKVHRVQPGETLYSLSKKYNVSIEELTKWNNMDLKAGQEIIVGKDEPEAVANAQPQEKVQTSKPVVMEQPQANQEPKVAAKKEEQTEIRKESEGKNIAKATSDLDTPKESAERAPKAQQTDTEPTKRIDLGDRYDFDPTMKQVLIIPFDPYLYFSDADHEIATRSNITPPKVREVFRRRLNVLLRAEGYENIHLLGGIIKDSIGDLNKIYSSVSYNYQEVLENPYYKKPEEVAASTSTTKKSPKVWLEKQKDKIINPQTASNTVHDKNESKYFGVKVRNPEEFFTYFNYKYDVDYYIFVNQFEVKTNYENCLDRAANNYERTFTTHFSIFDSNGKKIAGNKFKTFYNSNSSNIYTIVGDNMDKIASRIIAELPPPHVNIKEEEAEDDAPVQISEKQEEDDDIFLKD